MRKSEREVKDPARKFAALLRCGYLVLAMEGEEAPYQVPLNFGAELHGGRLTLYFHCAREGTKLGYLRRGGAVSFCAANMLRVFNKGVAPCGYTADYESVCGRGTAHICTDEAERLHGLQVLMAHYAGEAFAPSDFAPHALALTEVVRVDVEEWTCKRLVRS